MNKVGKTNKCTSGSLEEYVKPPDQTLRRNTECLRTLGNCSMQTYMPNILHIRSISKSVTALFKKKYKSTLLRKLKITDFNGSVSKFFGKIDCFESLTCFLHKCFPLYVPTEHTDTCWALSFWSKNVLRDRNLRIINIFNDLLLHINLEETLL